MPVYEYRCVSCNDVFEHLQGLNESDPYESPCCGGPVERLFSATADHRNQHPRPHGKTCCGRDERCEDGGSCCGR